jgi:hypothetical protein
MAMLTSKILQIKICAREKIGKVLEEDNTKNPEEYKSDYHSQTYALTQ